jgi:hypothetical protein
MSVWKTVECPFCGRGCLTNVAERREEWLVEHDCREVL